MDKKKFINWLSNQIVVYCLIGVMLACGVYKVVPIICEKTTFFCQQYNVNNSEDNTTLTISKNDELKQKMPIVFEKVKSINIHMNTLGQFGSGKVVLELWNDTTNKSEGKLSQELRRIASEEYVSFHFEKVKNINTSDEYSIRLRIKPKQKQQNIGVYVTADNAIETGGLYVNDELNNAELDFQIVGYNSFHAYRRVFLMLLILVCVTIMLMFYRVMQSPQFNSVDRGDWIFVGIAILICAFLLNQGFDMALTAHHSIDLLSATKHGKFFDFYSVVLDKALDGGYLGNGVKDAAFYNILLYIIMGVWLAPFYVVASAFKVNITDAALVLYYNVLLIILVIYSVYLVYSLAKKMEFGKDKALQTAYVYATSIMLLFATVTFSQMDIVYIIFILWALNQYMQKKYASFSILMSFAVMLKSFPIIIMVPLILLIEKRLLHIIKYFALGVSGPLLFKIFFGGNEGYVYTQKEMSAMYDFVGRLFQNQLAVGIGSCAFLVFIIVVLCVWCFDQNIEDEQRWRYVIMIPLVAFCAFFVFLLWHPEWLVNLAPFTALAIVALPQRRSLLYCDWGMGIMFWLVAANFFPQNVDNYMVNWGVLPIITGHSYGGIRLTDVFDKINNFDVIISTLLVSLLVYFCYYAVKDLKRMMTTADIQEGALHRGLVLVRCASVYLLIMLYVGMYFYVG